MQVGIDSYSYHRRYGEIRPREAAPGPAPWPLVPGPVLRHALAVGADALFLETCYLPEPETIDADMLAEAGPHLRLAFSWGHPWPSGRFHGLDGGRWYGAEQELVRWMDAASRLGHDVLRITAGSPASRGDEPAEVLVERLVGPVRRAADHAADRGIRLALENHGDLRVRGRPGALRARQSAGDPRCLPRQRQPDPGGRRHGRRDQGARAVHAAGPAQGSPPATRRCRAVPSARRSGKGRRTWTD